MSQKVFFIQLLLVLYVTQSQAKILANCNEDVPLRCPDDFNRMDFLSVTWYKFDNKKKLGIIRKSNGDREPQHYNFSRSTEFGENYSLFLRSVTPEDSGRYECAISANVGGKNKNLPVTLKVNECPTQAATTATASSEPLCNKQVEDLPVIWSIIGYAAVGLAKIVLSVISIWVIRAVRARSSRRRQQKW